MTMEKESTILKEYTLNVSECFAGYEYPPVIVYSVWSKDGGYVGRLKDVKKYFDKGILPELASKGHKVCSIGKSYKDNKWYGWSHRAMFGFKIGDKVKKGDCCASSGWTEEYLKEHPEEDLSLPVGFEAKTEEDTKRMAVAFADSVS